MAEPLSNLNDAGSPVMAGDEGLHLAAEHHEPAILPGMHPPDHLLPEHRNSRLEAAAERVGGAVGSAVGSMRKTRLRVVGGRRSGKAALREAAGSAGEKLSDLRDDAAVRFDELREQGSRRFSELAENVRSHTYRLRMRARHLANEYPMQTILGFGSLAFIAGFVLRIRRSNGD